MLLKNIWIKNYQCIKNTEIDMKNFMVFIGQSGSGKSGIMLGIADFLDYKKIQDEDINYGSDNCEIMGEMEEKNSKKRLKLKLVKEKNQDERYYIYNNNLWVEIKYEKYKEIVQKIEVMFVPTFLKEGGREKFGEVFIKKIQELLPIKSLKLEELLEVEKISYQKGVFRNIIFLFFKKIGEYYEKTGENLLGNILVIFEEPELYLHPQKEKELFYYLEVLANSKTQVLLSTHSSNFISLDLYQNICIVRKDETQGTRVFQNRETDIFKDKNKEFNMRYWINSDKGELFFAKKVILVEGQTDKLTIGYLAKEMGVYNFEVSIIECGSKNIIPSYIRLLNSFEIPYTAIYDKDNHSWRSQQDIENAKLKNRDIIRSIDTSLGDYIEFVNDIEEELQGRKNRKISIKNKPYLAMKMVENKNFIISEKLRKKIKKAFYFEEK